MPQITRPDTDQIKFISSKTGTHSLDTYLEEAEIADLRLGELVSILFNPDGSAKSGDFRQNAGFLEFRPQGGTTWTPIYNVGTAINEALVGVSNVATATALQTARNINGVPFNGTADVTIPAGIEFTRITSGTTLIDRKGVIADTSGGAFTVILPSPASVGMQVFIMDGADWSANALTVDPAGATIESLAADEDLVLDVGGASLHMLYDGSKWNVHTQVGAYSGQSLTETGVQTVTNKNLSSGTNTFPSTLATLTGTQTLDNKTLTSVNGGQLAGLRNKIINGKMEIAQRGTSFAAPSSGTYTLDRWVQFNNTTGVFTISQQADAPAGDEFQNSLRVAVTTADTSIAAGDLAVVRQWIEGFNARDLIGRTFTLSFWVRSSKTGVHCASVKNTGADRSFVAEYTVNAANTWEKKSVTVSGGLITAGTWNWTTGQGLAVDFTLAGGATLQTTAGAWQTGNFLATANQVNCLDTVGNIFAITGVQLEVGSVATPFEHRPYGMELALCQRYYYRLTGPRFGGGYAPTSSSALIRTTFPVPMRAAPSALEQSGIAGDFGVAYLTTGTVCTAVPTLSVAGTTFGLSNFTTAAVMTAGQAVETYTAAGSPFMAWSAEL